MMTSKRDKKGIATICPACDTRIFFKKRPGNGQMVVCRECDSLLQVVRLSPLRLAWAFQDPLDSLVRDHDKDETEPADWLYDDYEDMDEFEADGMKYRNGHWQRRYG